MCEAKLHDPMKVEHTSRSFLLTSTIRKSTPAVLNLINFSTSDESIPEGWLCGAGRRAAQAGILGAAAGSAGGFVSAEDIARRLRKVL